MKIISIFILIQFALNVCAQDQKLLTPTPPMGWNSWNWFGKREINEENMKACIDAMVDNGLVESGYNYFVIDGGWRDTKLGANGELLVNLIKFPHGIKALADYAHSKGLKFGLHTVPGTHDCGGDLVGGYGHEEVQVKQFVDWGLDFIKLDKCKYADGWDEELVKQSYVKWRSLLDNCGRDIVLSISAYKWREWYPQVGQMARTTGDITAKCNTPKGAIFDRPAKYKKGFNSVMEIAEINNISAPFAGNGYWNDPDMLVTGNQGLTQEEQQTHFALWCIMSSPLILGNDPREMSIDEKNTILNKNAIAINQDPTEQGRKIKSENGFEIWSKKLKNGKIALLVFNRTNTVKTSFNLNFSDLGISKRSQILNVYTNERFSVKKNVMTIELNPHACLFLSI